MILCDHRLLHRYYILHKTLRHIAIDKIEKITFKKNVNIHSVSKASGLNVCFKNPYLPSVT